MEVEVTDIAIQKLLEKKVEFVRLGVTGGGCAGFEYVFKDAIVPNSDDLVIDYGRFRFVIDPLSQPYLDGMTLDFVEEGLNEYFKFINPKEKSSCGCGVSVQFDI
jgi:iron-sulfur cluster assembly accessory protein